MKYTLDKKTEDAIKIKIAAELIQLVEFYWNEYSVDGITVLSCVNQLSEFMYQDLVKKVSEQMKKKMEEGVGNSLELKSFEDYIKEMEGKKFVETVEETNSEEVK